MKEITARELITHIHNKELPKTQSKATNDALENIRWVWLEYMEVMLKELEAMK
jgi:hypothetical protein